MYESPVFETFLIYWLNLPVYLPTRKQFCKILVNDNFLSSILFHNEVRKIEIPNTAHVEVNLIFSFFLNKIFLIF